MYLGPPIEEARMNLMQELFSWENTILSLPRMQHSRYQVRHEIEFHFLIILSLFWFYKFLLF